MKLKKYLYHFCASYYVRYSVGACVRLVLAMEEGGSDEDTEI